MKIIDSHLHFSNREGFKTTAREIGYLNYSASGLKKEFEQSNVVAGVIMATPDRKPYKPSGYPKEFILEDGTLDCLLSCVGVNPEQIKQNSSEINFIEEELNKNMVTGIKIYAGYFHYYVYDAIYDPIYELAKKYNVPVAIHCGNTQSSRGLLKYSHPLTIDELAVKHQDITFIICHMGVPWIMDTAELISKNHNVYTDLSGLIAGNREQIKKMQDKKLYVEYIKQGLEYASQYNKVLFGSDWPLVPISPYIEFIKDIIPEAFHENVFYKNALAVFPKMKKLIQSLNLNDCC
ncbi:MAG: amidohydrolase [Clostridiaceae bacterium BRH_c20a]|nr:MAG: amidohydrolase [Clostridiaceae bacterium BRH_c20a]